METDDREVSSPTSFQYQVQTRGRLICVLQVLGLAALCCGVPWLILMWVAKAYPPVWPLLAKFPELRTFVVLMASGVVIFELLLALTQWRWFYLHPKRVMFHCTFGFAIASVAFGIAYWNKAPTLAALVAGIAVTILFNFLFGPFVSQAVGRLLHINAPGTVVVHSDVEGADVQIDKRSCGCINGNELTVGGLRPGKHIIHLTKDQFVTWQSTTTVTSDAVIHCYADMKPYAGRITVTSRPREASVFVDGKYVGITPLTATVSAGGHKLEGQLADYPRHAENIQVSPDSECEILMDFFSLNLKEAGRVSVTPPLFNCSASDPEIIRACHRQDQEWTNPIEAMVGDEIAVAVYVHNCTPGSVSHATKVRVDIPYMAAKDIKIKPYIWSQESKHISSTIRDEGVIGLDHLQVLLPSKGVLFYVPGTTKLIAPNGMIRNLPDGITQNQGLNLGDIEGHATHAGVVTFRVEVFPPSHLLMSKKVAVKGADGWSDTTDAVAGDELRYRLAIENKGTRNARNVVLTDTLPTYMSYIPGSTKLYAKEKPEGVTLADDIFADGLAFPPIIPGTDGIVYVVYSVRIDPRTPDDLDRSLNNVAQLFHVGNEKWRAQASVRVMCKACKLAREMERNAKNDEPGIES